MTVENYNYYRHRRRSRLFSGKLARSFPRAPAGINKLPIRSRMISVIIGYNSLVEEYRCRRNKWVSRASVPRP